MTRLAQRGLKSSMSTASKGMGMLSRNDRAMKALDNYGAGGMVRSADGMMNRKKEGASSPTSETAPPATPPPKKSGMGGLGGLKGMFKESPAQCESSFARLGLIRL